MLHKQRKGERVAQRAACCTSSFDLPTQTGAVLRSAAHLQRLDMAAVVQVEQLHRVWIGHAVALAACAESCRQAQALRRAEIEADEERG